MTRRGRRIAWSGRSTGRRHVARSSAADAAGRAVAAAACCRGSPALPGVARRSGKRQAELALRRHRGRRVSSLAQLAGSAAERSTARGRRSQPCASSGRRARQSGVSSSPDAGARSAGARRPSPRSRIAARASLGRRLGSCRASGRCGRCGVAAGGVIAPSRARRPRVLATLCSPWRSDSPASPCRRTPGSRARRGCRRRAQCERMPNKRIKLTRRSAGGLTGGRRARSLSAVR